jgi:hypothetical protein
VIVHPGHFYDLEQDGAIVVSLIPEPEPFTKGLRRISEVLGAI